MRAGLGCVMKMMALKKQKKIPIALTGDLGELENVVSNEQKLVKKYLEF